MKLLFSLAFLIQCLLGHGASGADKDEVSVSVMEGDSVTLNTGVQTKEQEKIKWYFNDIRIAQITGDQNKICTDVQCEEGNERFRDRLKLDHHTGSLTIMNTKHTDAGVYELRIISSSGSRKKIFTVAVHGVFSVGPDGTSAFVMKGDSVTLHTGVQRNQQEKIIWYFNDMRIAQNTGDQSKICTDDQCFERFRGRLKLDPQTGSLTVTNTTNTDSGEYTLVITSSSSSRKRYSITVRDVSAAEQDEMKRKSVKEGESVTFDTRVIKQPNVSMMWYFNDFLIAEITGDQSKICTDEHCEERFRDRLKLDHQTGSLTVMNTRNTDSGEYKVEINGGSISIMKTFSSLVSATDSDPSSAAAVIAAVVIVVLLVAAAAAAGLIYHCQQQGNANKGNHGENQNVKEKNVFPTTPLLPATNGTGPPTADRPLSPATNGTGPPTADTLMLMRQNCNKLF